jgi:prepilin-type processing-associated H-X9-DG protein
MKQHAQVISQRNRSGWDDHKKAAFTQVDLLATMVGVALLAAWFGFSHMGERGRIAGCTRNLRVLGEATQEFANDHGSALPPAGVELLQTTWDMQLSPYLKPSLAKSNSPSDWRPLQQVVAPRFLCPSDPILRGDHPRSYAMSAHNMEPINWPPGPANTTGVGLWWSNDKITALLGDRSNSQNLEALMLVKFSWLPDPANTLLLTEYPYEDNRMGVMHRLTIANTTEQSAGMANMPAQFHHGRFNYLMADGHVESLTPLQTGAPGGDGGIWTIKAGD